MENGSEVFKEHCEKPGGIPWFVILNGDGKALANSNGPDGNCGCPVAESEIAHFMSMIEKTCKQPTKEGLAAIKKSLEEYTAQWRN